MVVGGNAHADTPHLGRQMLAIRGTVGADRAEQIDPGMTLEGGGDADAFRREKRIGLRAAIGKLLRPNCLRC